MKCFHVATFFFEASNLMVRVFSFTTYFPAGEVTKDSMRGIIVFNPPVSRGRWASVGSRTDELGSWDGAIYGFVCYSDYIEGLY